jgi:hypothetical protein
MGPTAWQLSALESIFVGGFLVQFLVHKPWCAGAFVVSALWTLFGGEMLYYNADSPNPPIVLLIILVVVIHFTGRGIAPIFTRVAAAGGGKPEKNL